ncbi:MAG: DNA polymerase I [Bacteroidales bacterium]|jgi:DNA polymerase-1|nr:DNA polymerase I [Bacteroidales bacterium]
MTENRQKKLFLIDAYALIFRSYYAFIKNPRITSKGFNTSAIFGFLLTLEEVLQKQKPTHIAVVFDTPTPTFRHELYKDYKAHRDETPEDIIRSTPYIKRLLEGYAIPAIQYAGYEADDVIGTLAKKAETQGFVTYMMTPDKDYAQLVSDTVFMYKPGRSGSESVCWGVADVNREFGIENPRQVIDILALMGDSADNVPGAPGIGPKTAMKLVAEYGSIEELLRNTSGLKGKMRESVENSKAMIELSKTLVTIETNVPVELNEPALRLAEPDRAKLKALFDELEFRSFAAKLQQPATMPAVKAEAPNLFTGAEAQQGSLFDAAPAPEPLFDTVNTVPHTYKMLSSEEEITSFVALALQQAEICFDTETTGINALETELAAISFSWEKGTGTVIRFPEQEGETVKILNLLRTVFENPHITKVGQNIKFDLQVLAGYGIEVKGALFDTMLAHYLLEPDQRHNMNALSEKYLTYSPIPIETLIGEKGAAQKNMRSVAGSRLVEYAAEDADITWQLKEVFAPMLAEHGLEKLATDIEMPLAGVLARMEQSGVKLDVDALSATASVLREDILLLEKEIYELAGVEFNISSPKQLGDVLFVRLKLDDKARMTKTKQFATNEETLQKLAGRHPVVNKTLEYRGLRKLLSTYVEALPLLVSKRTGRLHTSFNQAVASTGRLSSNNPNLQNIPVRDARGREIRKAFVPEAGRILFSADYSQIELRLMAHLSADKAMIADFMSGSDIHAATAAKIFNVPPAEVTRDMRSRAKTANFGIIYGISSFGLSERLAISRREAKELIDGYFAIYPGVRLYMDECILKARDAGYVTTMFGRKRYLPDIHSRNQAIRGNAERNAINAPIQGSAADLIKIAMINIDRRLRSENFMSKMILQVHDELIFEADPAEFDALKDMVLHEMAGAARLSVPLEADWGSGQNWLEAHR